ncbi:DNA cytosine methyltransferase [Clostridium sp. MD294]|uniref:DNA cytosine methyltransferase n=1 Tax=Clostridium sp. MD294 TaxID=97138 RepID=UPI0002CA75CB|nr:DNA cytosine methyltransferase [Clostridium sp. MD294]USF31170.1 Modification methylase HhaI [Clostridium sp. MD294]
MSKEQKKITFIDLFCGIGGFRLGMEKAGHICLGHCEIDKFAKKSYTAMHNIKEGEWYAEDITKVRAEEMPKVDCWCFGFPCQNISVAGAKEGLQGEQSVLFFEVIRLLKQTEKENRPEWLFIENVRNLLSIEKGFDFARILIALDKVGYDAEWQVLDSANFGVPQHRERLYIIGHIRGKFNIKIFPIPPKTQSESIKQIGYRIFDKSGISPTVMTHGGGKYNIKVLNEKEKTVRRLTPKECFRLQGFPDSYFEKAKAVNSNFQLYKQAENSVTVNVIYEIAKKLKKE